MSLRQTRLTYIGGPTLLIEIGGLRLLTDPTFDPAGGDYTSGPVTLSKIAGPSLDPNAVGKIDAVLLSHDHHIDNLDAAGRSLLPTADIVITTPEAAKRLGGNAIGLAPWKISHLSLGEGSALRVTATPARHGPEGGDRGPVTGFVLQAGNDDPAGAIYISGDTVFYEGVEETIHRFPQITVAILFLGAARIPIVHSHLTFTAKEAVRVALALPAATIVPLHYEGWKHFSESKEDVIETFAAAGLQHRLRWLQNGRAAELSV